MSEIKKVSLLDSPMGDVFSWSSEQTSLRNKLWDYFMEQAGHDPLDAEQAMLLLLTRSNEEIASFAMTNIKK